MNTLERVIGMLPAINVMLEKKQTELADAFGQEGVFPPAGEPMPVVVFEANPGNAFHPLDSGNPDSYPFSTQLPEETLFGKTPRKFIIHPQVFSELIREGVERLEEHRTYEQDDRTNLGIRFAALALAIDVLATGLTDNEDDAVLRDRVLSYVTGGIIPPQSGSNKAS